MDGNQFDALSRAFAGRASRRQAVTKLGLGGLVAGALGTVGLRSAASVRAAVGDECTFNLSAKVIAGDDEGDEYDGELTFVIGEDGEIDDGTFVDADGNEFEVVGQAVGRAINLRIDLEDAGVWALVGTGSRDLILCRGEIDGTFGNYDYNDVGTWRATKGGTSSNSTTDEADEDASSGEIQQLTPVSNGGGDDSNTGGDSNQDDGNSCATGAACGGQCCEVREGFSPEAISCDDFGYCQCAYSCGAGGSAQCPGGDPTFSFTVGCDDRPNALCGEMCNQDNQDESDDGGGDESLQVICGATTCTAYGGNPTSDIYCQGENCVCQYNCADVCPDGDASAFFSTSCNDDPTTLCVNFGC